MNQTSISNLFFSSSSSFVLLNSKTKIPIIKNFSKIKEIINLFSQLEEKLISLYI